MPATRVLDSWALLAYFEGQKEGARVKGLLQETAEKGNHLLMSVVNWGEVLYIVESRYGKAKAQDVERIMEQTPIEVIDADKGLTRQAAHLKATHKMPYGDCFAAALALERKAPLLTGDKDFKALERSLRIHWL